jgi:hypothetical protein
MIQTEKGKRALMNILTAVAILQFPPQFTGSSLPEQSVEGMILSSFLPPI